MRREESLKVLYGRRVRIGTRNFACLILLPLRWRQPIPSEYSLLYERIHVSAYQKTPFFNRRHKNLKFHKNVTFIAIILQSSVKNMRCLLEH